MRRIGSPLTRIPNPGVPMFITLSCCREPPRTAVQALETPVRLHGCFNFLYRELRSKRQRALSRSACLVHCTGVDGVFG
jgi:hypothetical protein